MFGRVAAWGFAAFLVVWPAAAGVEINTVADANVPAAAAVEINTFADANVPAAAAAAASVAPHAQTEDQAQDQTPDERRAENQIQDQASDHAQAPTQLAALDPAEPIVALPPTSAPFGLAATPVTFGGILTKWSGVENDIRADSEILARCRDNMQLCPKPARNFLAIVAQGRAQTGRARIGIINRAVNMAIEPMSDMAQWGVPDRWSAPLETFTTGRGDCEDYAIAKYVALTAAGVPAQDVKLVIVRNTAAAEDHAVVAVRSDGDWIILDNRWLTLVKDVDMPKAIPLFVLDDAGVREFVPPTLTVARRTAAPASF